MRYLPPCMVLCLALACSGGQSDKDLSSGQDSSNDAATSDSQPADSTDTSTMPDAGDVAADFAADTSDDQRSAPELMQVAYGLVYPSDPQGPELPAGVTIRVMSLNVYGGKMADAATIGAYVASKEVDLVGLQECSYEFGLQIAAAAGFEHTFGDGTFMMSKTPLEGAEYVPVLSGRGFVRAKTVIRGSEFAFYNTHLSWNVQGNLEFRYFTDTYLKTDPSPRIVMTGDFNDEHYSTQNTIMEEWGIDCFTAAGIHPGQRISWPSFGFDDTEGSQLIDLIWFRKDIPAIVLNVGPENVPGLLSDHKPVLAELLFPTGDVPFANDPFAARRSPFYRFPETLPENLLTNPDAEAGLDGWETTGGAEAAAQREHQTPRTGASMFAGASVPSSGVVRSTGWQDVDISPYHAGVDGGRVVAWVSGWLTTGYQIEEKEGEVSNVPKPYDDGELVLVWLGQNKEELGRWSSGRRDTLGWHPAAGVVALPPGTRALRLSWVSHHKEANGPSNDALFDDLYLGLGALDQPHHLLGPNLLGGGGGESGQLLDEGVPIIQPFQTPPEGADMQASAEVQVVGQPVWSVEKDLSPIGPWGFIPFAPWSWSGAGFLVATSKVLPKEQQAYASSAVCWEFALDSWSETIENAGLDLVATGWLRNYKGISGGRLYLTFEQPSPNPNECAVLGAEWTQAADVAQVPKGVRTGWLCVEVELKDVDDPVFVDSLSVVPVRRSPM